MAKFTPEQSNQCTVTKCESFKIDGVSPILGNRSSRQ